MQKIIIQNHSDADQRLDKFLKKFLPNAPLGAIYKMLRTGKIKVNEKKKEQIYRLAENDEILIFLTDEEIQNFQKISETPKKNIKKPRLEILYQDEDLMIVNKPAGINVHP